MQTLRRLAWTAIMIADESMGFVQVAAVRPGNYCALRALVSQIQTELSGPGPNTSLELHLLDQLVKEKKHQKSRTKPLSLYLIKLARLGGYLARAHDPPPGNMVIWRGLSRLTDIQLGFLLGAQLVGN